MGMNCLFALSCAVFCLLGVESQIFNEGKVVRNTRQRTLSKRPPNPAIISEDSFVVGNTKRPTYIEGGNQWKPLYNIPTRTAQSFQKLRSKPHIFSSKYQQPNNIYSSEFHPKSPQQQSTANFIANQSLLVADLTGPSSIKSSPSYKKSKYQYLPKKNYNQQYEVHEEVEDETPSYSTQNQNQYRFHDVPVIKSVKSPIKPSPSVQYSEMIGPEKHIHHLHYHDTMEEALKASATKQYVRNFRGSHPTSRRPY